MLALCTHRAATRNLFQKIKKSNEQFLETSSPSSAHGRFHRMRAFVARRAPNFPPQASVVGVFWCHLCSTEQAAAAKERQCGTAGQQHRPSDTWQTSQSNHLFTGCWDHQFGHQSDRAPTHQASAPSAPHRRRRHHGPPDPCARAGAGDRRCVVHIPQRKVLHRLLSRIRTSPPRRRDRAAFPSPPGALVRCMAPSRGRTSVAPLGRARKAGGRISGAPALHQFDGFD